MDQSVKTKKEFYYSKTFFIFIEKKIITKIKRSLASDPDLNLEKNPINPDSNELYSRCKDGILLW